MSEPEPVTLTFTISCDGLSPERLEEYKAALNALLGIDGDWEIRTASPPPSTIDGKGGGVDPY